MLHVNFAPNGLYLSTHRIVEIAAVHHNVWMQTSFVCHFNEQRMHTMILELVMLVSSTCLMKP